MNVKDVLTPDEWDRLYKSGAVKRPEPQISDEELLAILFEDENWKPRLLLARHGWQISHYLRIAREDMSDWLEDKEAREIFGLKPKVVDISSESDYLG